MDGVLNVTVILPSTGERTVVTLSLEIGGGYWASIGIARSRDDSSHHRSVLTAECGWLSHLRGEPARRNDCAMEKAIALQTRHADTLLAAAFPASPLCDIEIETTLTASLTPTQRHPMQPAHASQGLWTAAIEKYRHGSVKIMSFAVGWRAFRSHSAGLSKGTVAFEQGRRKSEKTGASESREVETAASW